MTALLADPLFLWSWVGDHLTEIGSKAAEHLYLTVVSVLLGMVISFPLARWHGTRTERDEPALASRHEGCNILAGRARAEGAEKAGRAGTALRPPHRQV